MVSASLSGELRRCKPAMRCDKDLLGLIDLIYQAVLDAELWPSALIKLADTVGAPQIGMPSFDWRANVFTTIAPRFDPELLAIYDNYFAFREPIGRRAARRPASEIYVLEDLIPREEFAATRVFNEVGGQVAAVLLQWAPI
jgi:hypothetical protein